MTLVNAYFDNIREEILVVLDSAESSIKVCMAWLTDGVLMQKLLDKLDEGVAVEICLLDHKFNRIEFPVEYGDSADNLKNYFANLKEFQRMDGVLNIVPANLGFVHHKFAIIDQKITITGSYNWSKNAANNKENIVIISDPEVAEKFITQMEGIVSIHHDHIIDTYFTDCNTEGCQGKIFKIKIIDCRSTSKYGQNDTYIISICTENYAHVETLSDVTETNDLPDIIEYEYEELEREFALKNEDQKRVMIKKRIDFKIAWSLDSRQDVFIQQNSEQIYAVYQITDDIEGDVEIKAVWEHVLIKPYSLVGCESLVIEHLDSY